MTTLQESAMRLALAALTSTDALPYEDWMRASGHPAIKALNAALAQQELSQKERPDFMAGYDAGMADAKRMAQQAATKNCPQPEICGSKECEFCRDTAAPQAQDGRYIIAGSVWFRKSTNEWVLELSGSINDTSFVSRHTQPAEILPENVPSLSTLYAPAPQAQDALQDIAAYIGVGGYNGATTEQLSERIRVEFDRLATLQSAQSEDGCAPNHMCNGHRVHIPTGECCNKCGATSW